jgi:protein-tyrosine phosphatase
MKINFVILMFVFLPAVAWAQQRQTPASSRELSLAGAVNFRDLGGYSTTDFRRIDMRRVYRAGDISKLTDEDMEELKRRKIYTVIDFRGDEEAAAHPDRLLPGADYLRLSAGSDKAADWGTFVEGYASGKDVMIAFYSDVSVFKDRYRPFFRKLLTAPDTSAVVFHCSAGKDRTGIAAALFLYALEVPMETIIADYVASNHYRKSENEETIEYLVNEQGFDRKMATELMEASPLYLEAAMNALKRRYGSIDSFMYKELGLDEIAKMKLREKFLR